MGVAHGDMWHLNIIPLFIIIIKLIISQPSNKMWISFQHVFICEGQLYGDMWNLNITLMCLSLLIN
jgi:hypothetical protein